MNWKKIKSLFVVEENEKQTPKPPVEKKTKKTEGGNKIVRVNEQKKQSSKEVVSDDAPSIQAEKGEVKSQFVEHLTKALEENNLDGIDYFEFKNTLMSFAKMPMDDNLRYQSALTAVKTMGASEQKIISSAQHYLSVLAKEEASFKKAVERGKTQKVDGELQRIEQLKKMRNERLKTIEKMKAEVEKMTQEINHISKKVKEDQAKIDTKRNHFYASYEFVVKQIKADLEQLKQFTQQTPKDNTKK